MITLENIFTEVAKYFGLTIDDLKSNNKSIKITFPRHIACYISVVYCKFTYNDVGFYLNGRDRTTIYYANKAIAEYLVVNKFQSKRIIDKMLKKLGFEYNELTALQKQLDELTCNFDDLMIAYRDEKNKVKRLENKLTELHELWS